MSDSALEPSEAYERLAERAERAGGLETIDNLLFWDQQVMMPPGGTPGRSMQRGLLSTLQHEAYVGDDVASWLSTVDGAELSDDESAVVREVRQEHERRSAVPQSLEERRSETISEANEAWEDARENDDFDSFAPYLDELVELTREKAAAIDPDREPFAVILGEYEPYLDVATVESVFDDLRR